MELEVISREPEGSARRTPVLFVHGICFAAWCWEEYFLPYFADNGYSSHALSLRGHGGSAGRDGLRWTGIDDYLEDLAQVADSLERPPVLVGHSLGGLVVQKYLETRSAPAAVLMASVPPRGGLRMALRYLKSQPLPTLKGLLTLNIYRVVGSLELSRLAFFPPDMPQEKVDEYFELLQVDSSRAVLDAGFFRRPKPEKVTGTPVLVIGAENDASFSVKEIRETAEAYGTEAVIFEGVHHAMMLEDGWRRVADRIVNWLREQGL